MMKTQKHKFKCQFLLVLFFLFPLKALAAHYWVGGQGSWSDIRHWRTSSGGTSIPPALPGPHDDVVFDIHSGFTGSSREVTVEGIANCRNIRFLGNGVVPNFGMHGQELNIFGSSEWRQGMNVKIKNINYRHTGEVKTIKSNGGMIYSELTFEEETTINLLDDFSLSGDLFHVAGTLNSNDHKVTLSTYIGNTGSKPRILNMGSSDFYVSETLFSTDSSLMTLNSGTSHIHFTGYSPMLMPFAGQVYHNISFESTSGVLGYSQTDIVYYNRVEFKGTGLINKDNEIRELVFSEGKGYILEASSTQRVTSLLSAEAQNCGAWMTIGSSVPGTQASLVAPSGVSVDISRAILSDIHASGGAVFAASGSTDNGNNTGWTFPSSSVRDLYWIGGSGDWKDTAHWSSASGGPGGACTPGPKDNVFFDANSGFTAAAKTITLSSVSYCRNISFSGSAVAPILEGSTAVLHVYGSSEWQIKMKVKIGTVFYQNTNTPKTIKSNEVVTGGEVHFGEENSISILDDFSISGILHHTAGIWNTNNHKVSVKSYIASSGPKPRTINMGSSNFYITLNTFSTDSPLTTVNSGTSHIHFTGTAPMLEPQAGQIYYNVSFESDGMAMFGSYQSGKVYYNRVEFKDSGKIMGDNQIKELIFTEGKTYSLESASTQTVTSLFSTRSSGCGDWIIINALTAGSQAKLVAASGVSIDVSRVLLQDIHASGGAVFSAVTSTDSGNNTGWTFPASPVQDLYWVGGSGTWNDKLHWARTSGGTGGYCIPGSADNVFFDINSGFTASDKTVTLSSLSYCRNITFSGSTVSPAVNGYIKDLNIYGSSEWQTGMTLDIGSVYYRNTNMPKTIKTNGVSVDFGIYFEEESTISLLDDFLSTTALYHHAGTWNTNNRNVNLGRYIGDSETKPRTVNMGSSDFYISDGDFSAGSSLLTLNSGTSHIHFLDSFSRLSPFEGQIYYNVSFEGDDGILGDLYSQSGKVYYNQVEFKGDGNLIKDNQMKELILTAGKRYKLGAGSTQTITERLFASGNSCFVLFLKSSVAGTKANLNIEGGSTNFDFANVKDISASGQALNFGSKSTDAGNNSNITFETYDPSAFSGFAGQDWSHAKFKNNDPDSYTLSTAGFYGNPYTTYKWTKINDPAHTGTIATGTAVDMRAFGYGTYHVKVEYSAPGSPDYCVVEESIMVKSFVPSMMNPGLPIRNY